MKAIVRETYGPPDVLRLEDVPRPAVRDGDVLVKVRAASANAGDWHLLRGTPLPFRLVAGLRKPKFKIIGNDIAGCVEAVGRNVTQFRPGDRCVPARAWPICSRDRASWLQLVLEALFWRVKGTIAGHSQSLQRELRW